MMPGTTGQNTMPDAEDRRFRIQSGKYYGFFAGQCANGRQVIMGSLWQELVGYFFDSDGTLLNQEARPWSASAASRRTGNPPHKNDPEFNALIEQQLQAWQAEIGFQIAIVEVKEFHDTKRPVGIDLLPDHLLDLDEEDEDTQHEIGIRDKWLANGNFVWWWNENYDMSATGEVSSS